MRAACEPDRRRRVPDNLRDVAEQSFQEKQFDLLYDELRRIAAELEGIRRRLEVLEALGPAVMELSRLSGALESLAYAALGREGPQVRRRRRA